MRISDWSSDVCSSDLRLAQHLEPPARRRPLLLERIAVGKVRIIAEMMRGRARDSADEPLRSSDLSHPHTLERLDALVDLIGNPVQIHGPPRRHETRPCPAIERPAGGRASRLDILRLAGRTAAHEPRSDRRARKG